MLIFLNKCFIIVIFINCFVYGKKNCIVVVDKKYFYLFCCLGVLFFKGRKMGIKIVRDKYIVVSVYGKLMRFFCLKYIIFLFLEEMK